MAYTPRYADALDNVEYRKKRAENAQIAANVAEKEYVRIIEGKAGEERRKAELAKEMPLFLDEYGRVMVEVCSCISFQFL